MMLFAYQQSPEPVIKNRVLSDALDKDLGPRNMAQGGRIGYADKNAGTLVKKLDKANEKRKIDSFNELYKKYGKEVVDDAAKEWAEMSNLEKNRKNKLKVQNFDLMESGVDRSTFKVKFLKDIKDFGEWTPDRKSIKNKKLYPASSTSNKVTFKSLIFDALGRKDIKGTNKPNPNYNLPKLKAMQKNFAEYELLKTYLNDNFGIVTALDHPLDKATIETIMNASSKDLINVNILEQNLNDSFKKTLNNRYRQAVLDGNLDQKRAVETIAKKFKLNIGSVPDNQFKAKQVGPFQLNKIDKGVGSFETLNIKDEMLKSLKNASTLDTEWGDYIKNNPDVFKEAGIDLKKLKKPRNVENITKNLPEIEKQIKIFKKMGFRCNKAAGGAEDVACYLDDVKKTKADARSSDVLKRAKALTKERKALQVAKTLPKVGNIIRKGVQLGAGAVSGALSAVGLGPVGFAIEAAIEGGFYDNARRNGYTHQQAYAETFLPKLITDAAGTTNTNTSLFEGAENMIEKEKLGKEDSLANQYNNAQNIFEQETNVLDNMVGSYEQMVDGKQKDELLQKIYLQEAKVTNLLNTIKPGTPAYEAYQIAEENQTGRMENRKNDYLSMNRIPYIDAQGNMQEKTFPLSPAQIKQQEPSEFKIKQQDKKRNEAMEEYKTGYDGTLEPFFIKENERVNWGEVYGEGPDQEANKWKDIFEGGGAYDLTDKIAIAGGVSKMATGGLASLKRKL